MPDIIQKNASGPLAQTTEVFFSWEKQLLFGFVFTVVLYLYKLI